MVLDINPHKIRPKISESTLVEESVLVVTDIIVTVENGTITARWGDAELPGYFEMWFSWATHNQETGIVI